MTLDDALQVRNTDLRHEYARTHPLLLSVVVAAFLGGVVVFVIPSVVAESSVGMILAPVLRWVWALFYLAGSSGVIAAFWVKASHPHLSVKIEAFCLCMLSTCYMVFVASILANRGVRGGGLAASVFTGLAIGTAARALTIVTERHLPWRSRRP